MADDIETVSFSGSLYPLDGADAVGTYSATFTVDYGSTSPSEPPQAPYSTGSFNYNTPSGSGALPAGSTYDNSGSVTILSTPPAALAIVPNFALHFEQANPSSYSFLFEDSNYTRYDNTPACFLIGTRIRTPAGEVAVERLQVGDLVATVGGAPRPIRWIGRSIIDTRQHPDPVNLHPVTIATDALGPNMPSSDLVLSPGHAVVLTVVDPILVNASHLANGVTIVQTPVDHVDYWHIELDRHDIIIANGAHVESYRDTGNRASFTHSRGAYDVFQEGRTDPCLPHLSDEATIRAVRSRLRARAVGMGWRQIEDPVAEMMLLGGGEPILPTLDRGEV